MSSAPPPLSYLAGLPALPPDALYCRWEWHFPQASPAALWPLAANTDRFNFDSGLPHERNAGDDRSQGIPRQNVTVAARGIKVGIVQRPFEWVEPQWFGVYRSFDAGPLALFRNHVELLPDGGGGTRLVYHSWSGTRGGWLGRQAWEWHMRTAVRPGVDRAFRRYGELAGRAPSQARSELAGSPSAGPVELAPGGRERLDAARRQLDRGVDDAALVARLIDLLERGDGFAASRIKPYELAALWGAPRRGVLELCLRATRAGLLDLRWDLLCPLCRGAKFTAGTLADVQREVHCDACNIDFAVNFERQVELSFRANSAVRPAPDLLYCAGAPGLTPHIAVQLVLGPGEARTAAPALAPGRYRLRLDNVRGGRYLRVAPGQSGAPRLAAGLDPAAWAEDEPELASAPQLELHNATDRPQLAILERLAWADDAVTAAEVTTLQLFRDLFSREALRPGQEISVGRVAVLFTDLVASTRLYREIGDAPAFGRVMAHFDVLREELDRSGGAIVKTIGDAILAVATSPLPMLRAMLAAQARLAAGESPLLLKAGLHLGPCIAVTLNERLDYFGTTVNFASRLAHVARGVEVVVSDEVRRDPEVEAWLAAHAADVRLGQLRVELKSFEEESAQLWQVQSKLQMPL